MAIKFLVCVVFNTAQTVFYRDQLILLIKL